MIITMRGFSRGAVRRGALGAGLALTAVVVLSGCGGGATAAAETPVAATVSDNGCTIATTAIKGPAIRFTATNAGTAINEFYVYQADGKTLISEVEDLDPGKAKDLVVQLAPGNYMYGCKPGMKDENLKVAAFTVS